MRNIYKKMASLTMITAMVMSAIPTYAAQPIETVKLTGTELPKIIVLDGREFTMDESAGGGFGTAEPDQTLNGKLTRSSYTVLGSNVRLYVDYGHGHGGDNFAAGWVETTAPSFTARAEVWANGKLDTTGPNSRNSGKRADASSYLATGIIRNATPRIFYNW